MIDMLPHPSPNIANKSDQHTPVFLRPESEHSQELKLVPNEMPPPDHASSPMLHPTVDISRQLKAPRLGNVKPNTVSYQQAHKGININIPGSAQMRFGDTLAFYWGSNKSSTQLHMRTINKDSTVRVLCISYDLLSDPQYGLVDVYYEVHRNGYLIGTSPTIKVTVHSDPTTPTPPPATAQQAQKKPQNGEEKAA